MVTLLCQQISKPMPYCPHIQDRFLVNQNLADPEALVPNASYCAGIPVQEHVDRRPQDCPVEYGAAWTEQPEFGIGDASPSKQRQAFGQSNTPRRHPLRLRKPCCHVNAFGTVPWGRRQAASRHRAGCPCPAVVLPCDQDHAHALCPSRTCKACCTASVPVHRRSEFPAWGSHFQVAEWTPP